MCVGIELTVAVTIDTASSHKYTINVSLSSSYKQLFIFADPHAVTYALLDHELGYRTCRRDEQAAQGAHLFSLLSG